MNAIISYDARFPEHRKVWEALCLVHTRTCQGCFSTCRPAQRLRVRNATPTGFEFDCPDVPAGFRLAETADEWGYDTKRVARTDTGGITLKFHKR